MDLSKISFVDIETTGASIYSDRVIEIGILRVENGKLVKTYETLINPETYLPPFIEGMTGISAIELEKAPTFFQVKEDILDALKDSVFVAHNVRFDYGFLKNEFKRHDISFSSKHFCTVKLSRYFYPRRRHHNLDSVIEKFGIECSARHRAYGDAEVLWKFYQLLGELHGPERLLEAVREISKRPSLPSHLVSTLSGSLPSSPGVYIFFGENDAPLYVGKSINIKKRVLSHFSNDHTSSQEMKITQNAQRIEFIPTAGELSALLLEASLVKKLQPLYNRTLRRKHELIIAKKQEWQGYNSIALENVKKLAPQDAEIVVGTFRSRRHAKEFLHFLSKEYCLCQKLLGLENTNSACFSYRLGKCKGACVKKESSLAYNMRFAQSFAKTKIKPWPFSGPIAIEEKQPCPSGCPSQKVATFVVDKWCLLGENLETLFDLDTYKILNRFIKNPNNLKMVRSITPKKAEQLLPAIF